VVFPISRQINKQKAYKNN